MRQICLPNDSGKVKPWLKLIIKIFLIYWHDEINYFSL